MLQIKLQPPTNLPARWQTLEQHATPSFFQSWTFLGCQFETRFAGAQLLCVSQDGADIALALLGTGRQRLWLNQTGNREADQVFIEHNALLVAQGEEACVPAALRTAARAGIVEMGGVDDATLNAARQAGWVAHAQSRLAPYVALDQLRQPYLNTLSSNARAQIRRAQRLYGAGLALSRAANTEQALAWFAEMVALHQQAWNARGKPGAFASPAMLGFHAELIARAWPAGEADLLRIAADGRHIGTLYNLIRNGSVHCYQSGFAYSADPRDKPGLCCHALAIEHYAQAGVREYDFLGGADRYKTTLAQNGRWLHWGSLHGWKTSGSFLKKRTKKLLSESRLFRTGRPG